MEMKLIDEKKLYFSLLYNSPNPVLVIGSNTTVFYVNPAFEKLTGYSLMEIKGLKPPYPWWTEKTLWKDEMKYKDSFHNGIKKTEQVFKDRNGELFWVEINMNVIRIKGVTKYAVSNWLDISERRKTEKALIESEEKYRNLAESGCQLIDICSRLHNYIELNGTLQYVIRRIREISGIEAVSIRLHDNGEYPYYVYDGFPEEFIKKENELCIKDEQNNRILLPDGKHYLLKCMCGNVIRGRYDDSLDYFTERGTFFSNNNTHLLNSLTEEKLQNNTRNYCNSCGYESVALIPIKTKEENIGLIQLNDKRQGMITDTLLQFCEKLGEVIGMAVQNNLTYWKLKDSLREIKELQELLPICANCKKIKDDDGYWESLERYFYKNTHIDFTHGLCPECLEKALQNKFNEGEIKRIEEIIKKTEKITFNAAVTSGIIHEIRVPLDAMKIRVDGMSYLHDAGIPNNDDKYIDDLKHLAHNLSHIEEIINTMRKRFSKKQDSLLQKCNVNEVVSHVVTYMKHKLLSYDIELKMQFIEEEVPVFADFIKLEEVLINLILNSKEALDNTKKKNKYIKVITKKSNTRVILEVIDNGPGIEDNKMSHLFEPFYTSKDSNMGLGLFLSKHTINEFQGDIFLSNNINGRGTTARIELPLII